jgi:hypothetical protein
MAVIKQQRISVGYRGPGLGRWRPKEANLGLKMKSSPVILLFAVFSPALRTAVEILM